MPNVQCLFDPLERIHLDRLAGAQACDQLAVVDDLPAERRRRNAALAAMVVDLLGKFECGDHANQSLMGYCPSVNGLLPT
jgi:hypothetical protein